MPWKPKSHAQRVNAVRQPAVSKEYNRTRTAAKAFYWGTRWRKIRAKLLRERPLCEDCQSAGRTTPATEVHHIIDREQQPDLSYDMANLQALCKPCHSRHTARATLNAER